jgi:MoaA/NifB/PqqE/SkfB family radical SAM enzyme
MKSDTDQGMNDVLARLQKVRDYSKKVRASEYHLTNACNIRCKGCWFFEKEFDKPGVLSGTENKDLAILRSFVQKEKSRGINTALLIGGEPTLFANRIEVYVEEMTNVTISTNGWKPFPYDGFQDVNVAISVFGGLKSDDALRAIRPNGATFDGLFDAALKNYENDDRAIFIYATSPALADEVIPTVERIVENGNIVNFNFYSDYSSGQPLTTKSINYLKEKMLEAKERWPKQVTSHPYFIESLLTGKSHFGKFGYESCPSVSVDAEENSARIINGNKILPMFNAWAADLTTVLKCCTSGQCASCRDSQAVYSWLMVNHQHFLDSTESTKLWTDIAESYWSQFSWSIYSPYNSVESRNECVGS